ncbi:MAG: YciI family protein [Spirochaetota bacterium]
MFVISSVYKKPVELIDAHVKAHREFLDRYYEKGIFITSGPKEPRTGGIILAKTGSKEELMKIMAEDPFSIHGISEYEYTEFKATKSGKGLEKLLD